MRLILKLIFILFFCFVSAPLVSGRENYIRFERISSKQGLAQSVVLTILQDRKGFMWFGTHDGLIRFDGYKFAEFRFNPKQPSSLPVNRVLAIHEDQAGILWVGTAGGGLNRFNPRKQDFTRFRYSNPSDPDPGQGVKTITGIYEDRNGILWLGTYGGMLRFDPVKGEWIRFSHKLDDPWNLNHNTVTAICGDHAGMLWIGTRGGGLSAFEPESKTFIHYTHQPGVPGSLSSNIVENVLEDRNGNLWVGTTGGLDRFDRRKEQFIHYRSRTGDPDSLSHNSIYTLFEDSVGNLWIGTQGGGLNRVKSLTSGSFIHFRNQPNNPHSLGYDTIFTIAEDRGGSIWIGTDGGGISRIDQQKQQFGHFLSSPETPDSLNSNDISSLYRDREGVLWIGTYDKGLNLYDRESGTFKYYMERPGDPGSLSNNEVIAIYEDRRGVIWIGTWEGGICRFERDTETFTRFRHDPASTKGPSSNDIFCFNEDQDGQLWIGTWGGGLNRFVPGKEEFVYYQNVKKQPDSISGKGVTALLPDRVNKKWLWVGTYGSGLDCLDRQSGRFHHYIHEPGNPDSLSHNTVRSLYVSSAAPGIIWIGTSGGGLNRFDAGSKKWRVYTKEDGLPNNTIHGILEDSKGNLWMSTNNGLSSFNPGTGDIVNYTAEDGIQANEFSQGAYHKDKDGRFYFGGINGYNEFFPERIKTNPHPPPVVITSFKILNEKSPYYKKSLEKPVMEASEVHLSYRDVFSFEFAALNYIATAKNRYKYKMEGEGVDENWVQLEFKRDVIFNRLSPGDYTFRVKASNNDGVWNEQGASIKVTVHPPFWATTWFRVLVFLLLIGMIIGSYKMRVRQYKLQRKRLEQQVAKRTAEIRYQKEIIEEKNTQLEVSNRELVISEENLIELNATKDKFFSIISHDLRNHLTTLMGTSDLLANSFDMLAEEKKVKYSKAIDRSANQLYELLDNLLLWARSQKDVLKCKPKRIHLSNLIPETISYFNMNAKKKKIHLEFDAPGSPDSSLAYADRNMVTTVLRNLISNAIKFTEKGGEVRMTVEEMETEVLVSVKDNGVGISLERAGTLFNVGMTESTRGTAKEKGTGLGLILCKEFVEKNNGRIWYEPAGERGSIFRFTLPLPEKKHYSG
jgi:ligand-binding sensor domain-containing protein/signal transduction histidine kinase